MASSDKRFSLTHTRISTHVDEVTLGLGDHSWSSVLLWIRTIEKINPSWAVYSVLIVIMTIRRGVLDGTGMHSYMVYFQSSFGKVLRMCRSSQYRQVTCCPSVNSGLSDLPP